MLVVALVLAILAAAFAAFDWLRSGYNSFIALAISLLSLSFAVYIVDILQGQGKL